MADAFRLRYLIGEDLAFAVLRRWLQAPPACPISPRSRARCGHGVQCQRHCGCCSRDSASRATTSGGTNLDPLAHARRVGRPSRRAAHAKPTGCRSRRTAAGSPKCGMPHVTDSVGREQSQPLALGQVPRRHDEKVPLVKSCDFAQVKPFCQRDDTGVQQLQAQGRVRGQQLGHPPVVMRGDLDDPQLVGGDCCAGLSRELGAAPPLRIGQQMANLSDC